MTPQRESLERNTVFTLLSRALRARLDVLVVRKLGIPGRARAGGAGTARARVPR